jgi:hypothetical protein
MAWGRRTFGQDPDLLLLERILDIACHDAFRMSERVTGHLKAPLKDPALLPRGNRGVQERRPCPRRVQGGFRRGQRHRGSVHGFTLETGALPTCSYNHNHSSDCSFLAAGPALRPGRVEGLSIFDLLPLLPRLKGFPMAGDLPGRVPREVLSEDALARPEAAATQMDEEILERACASSATCSSGAS